MIPEFGSLTLILALCFSVLSLVTPLLKRGIGVATIGTFTCISLSFLALLYAHSISDFSVQNVYQNSHTAKPLIYKISGAWGNHEGSMLLWVWLLSLCSGLFFILSSYHKEGKAAILTIQGAITTGFLAFIIFTSSPFVRLSPVPENGEGLNPLLQDIGLALHPPGLYLGYVGFSIAFSAAIIALLKGEADSAWARMVKPWVLFSWTFLTLGIGLGSWWAYRELGWGGFWFWDPVENASLMPWLAGTALIHSLMVTEKRGSLKSWTLLLALFTFCLSLLGTFLVRSGVLTSVHSFANDPERGFFILMFLSITAGGSLLLFAFRGHKLATQSEFTLLSRDSTILINNLLLVTSCITIMLGTLYPLFYEMLYSSKISVGEPYFQLTFVPIMLPLLAVAAISPMLKWQSDSLTRHWRMLAGWLVLAVMLCGGVWVAMHSVSLLTLAGLAFSVWLISAVFTELARRVRLLRMPLGESLALALKLPAPFYGMVLAHLGLGIAALGIIVVSSWGAEKELVMREKEKTEFAGYVIRFDGVTYDQGSNYLMRRGTLYVATPRGDEVTTLKPESRFYPVEKSQTTESAIYPTVFSDFYAVIGDEEKDGSFAVRFYFRPFISWIWAGVFLMVAGGATSIFGRRKTL